jgi:carboxyl-terminal processing protease
VVYSTEYFDGLRQEKYLTRLAPTYTGPLAVLINANTASAAEILAGSLQDHSRGIVVGERSFGKGSFQAGRVWEQNSKIAFFKTQGLYYLPSGRSTQNVGVSPDIEVVGPGPQSQREADLYSNTIATQLSTRTVLNSLIADSCSSVEQEAILGAFASDRQMGKAYRALDCLRGVYGTTAD